MAKKLTNASKATRIVNTRDGERVRALSIAPGETVECTPVDTPAFRGAVAAGRLVVSGSRPKAEKPADKEGE